MPNGLELYRALERRVRNAESANVEINPEDNQLILKIETSDLIEAGWHDDVADEISSRLTEGDYSSLEQHLHVKLSVVDHAPPLVIDQVR